MLTTDRLGPFVRLGSGHLMTVEKNATAISDDEGQTWSRPRSMTEAKGLGVPTSGGLLLRAHDGALVYVYLDMATFKWSWSDTRQRAGKNVRLDVWCIRSANGGKTWTGRKRIFEGYCGALINMIQTSSGEIVVPIQRLVRDPDRHAICVYVSSDTGKTWKPGNLIDLGGHGHHDGALEPTIVELKDGRLWMLIRTNLDYFWEAFSSDKGRSWRVIRPASIDASSAPGAILRLASGRLALAWNRLCPKGRKRCPRRGGDGNLASVPASWHREELSLSFSKDDGQTWTDPAVVLRLRGGGLSYPYLFEPAPGQLWVSTLFSDRGAIALEERAFVR